MLTSSGYCYTEDAFEALQALGLPDSAANLFYSPMIYQNIGKSLLISILDILQINPYTRIANSEWRTMD